MLAFEYENHTKYLTKSLQGLFERNLLIDCTISAEQQFIYGHQVILAACSPYFELLFSQKQDKKPVFLKDVKFQDLKSLVDFMYFGEVYIPTEQLNSFVETAKALQVKGLTNLYKQENNVECSGDSEVNVKDKCGKRKWNFCEKTFEIKTESESQPSTSGSSETEKYAELNYNADGYNEDSVRELKLTFNRFTVIEKSKDVSQYPDNNNIQDVAESGSFSGELKMEYEDNCSAVSLLPFIKEENESYSMQDDFNLSNVSNRNIVDYCPVDIETVVKGEIEIEENELNFHENHEVTNLSEFTSNNALPSISQDSLNHATAACVISGADSYKDFNVNLENITSEFITVSPKQDGFEESRGSCGDNVILGLENVDLNVWSSNSYGQGEESRSNDSGSKLHLPDNTIALRFVETEQTKLCENSKGQTGLLEDTAIEVGDGTGFHVGREKFKCKVRSKRSSQSQHLEVHHLTRSGKNIYHCSVCPKKFAHSRSLKDHLLRHSGEKKYECSICSKRFALSCDLKRHHLTHSGEKNYQCTLCPKRFARPGYLKEHLLTHSGEKKYQCTVCLKRFARPGYLKGHLLTHRSEKKYECTLCPKKFAQSAGLSQHLLRHSGEKKYQCTLCPKRFALPGGLSLHLLRHSGEKKYQCTMCLKRFARSGHLKQHLLTHSGEKKYQCTVCLKRFAQSGYLKEHLLRHKGGKKYECSVCSKRFALSCDLKKHHLTHSGKKYQCTLCPKRFVQSSHLKEHLLIHSGEKKYECTLCPKKFAQSAGLKQHLLTHSDEKEMHCAHCSKVFRSKERLIVHLRVHN